MRSINAWLESVAGRCRQRRRAAQERLRLLELVTPGQDVPPGAVLGRAAALLVFLGELAVRRLLWPQSPPEVGRALLDGFCAWGGVALFCRTVDVLYARFRKQC